MTFSQLRILVAVVDHRGFTAAAEASMLSQPAVSHAVRALERELGATLLERGRDGVIMTEAGRRVVERARAILAHEAALRDDATAGAEPFTLKVGTLLSTERMLTAAVTEFRGRQPRADVRLVRGMDDELLAWLEGGVIDVAVARVPPAGLTAVPLTSDEVFAVLPPAHPLARHDRIRLETLFDEPFVMCGAGCEPMIQELATSAGRPVRTRVQAVELASLLDLVSDGQGVSLIPALVLEGTAGNVAVRPLEPPEQRHLSLCIARDSRIRAAGEAFAAVAADAARRRGMPAAA
jgi:DNA-binding transcriptional LysR family regulator